MVPVRLDGQSRALSIVVALEVRAGGQKVLPGRQAPAGERREAARDLLQDLESRGLKRPELVVIDGGKGLEAAVGANWPRPAMQRWTGHRSRNLIARAPKKLHEELTVAYSAMICFEALGGEAGPALDLQSSSS